VGDEGEVIEREGRYVARGAPFFRAVWNEDRTYLCWDEPATHATPLGEVLRDN
jgi:hypothetical protein